MKLSILIIALVIVWLTGCAQSDSDAERFSRARQRLADNALDGVIMPAQIAAYARRSSRGYVPPRPDARREYIGVYESLDGKEILLTAILSSKASDPTATSSDSGCDTDPAAVTSTFMDRAIPYVYKTCQAESQFNWINGNWLMSAATYYKTNSADLVQFVNSYPY